MRLLSWFLCSLLPLLARAQAPLRKDLRRDFGAVGDGRADDHAAFQRAADFFNRRARTPAGAAPAVLFIPAGTYRVGRQDAAGNGADVLALTGCRNLRIVGQDSARTLIRYASGLRYGAFDPATGRVYEAPQAFFTDWKYGARVATCINLQKCENVEVSDLSLDGSAASLVVGGHWGDTGIQLSADGIFVGDSRRLRLRRLAVHHFGRDGVQVLNRLAKSLNDPNREDILLENSTFDYNGRQGLSLTGVNGLRASNCSFSHTGRVVIPALGKALFSNPGAGVDVEPEGGFASHVRLEGCRLVDNAGQGLVADRYGDGPPTTQDIVLSHCLLWGTTNWSAWVRQTDFLFENCRLYGAFTTGCALAAYPTRFVGCTFEDRPYHDQPAYGLFLLDSDREARAMSFTSCRFVAHRAYLLRAVPAAPDSASAFRVRGCTFVLDYAGEVPLGAAHVLAGAVLAGDNAVVSGPLRADTTRQVWRLGAADAPAPVVVAGSQLRLLAPGLRCELPGGLTVGPAAAGAPASVEVGAGTSLVLPELAGQTPQLAIGPAARLLVRRGGTLVLAARTKLTIAGQLLVEDGGHVSQDPRAEVALPRR